MFRTLSICLTTLIATTACAPEDSTTTETPTSNATGSSFEISREALINGLDTFDRPEAGFIDLSGGLCTATLIRPNVVLTAAHCIDYQSGEARPGRTLGAFIIERGPSEGYGFPIDAFASFGGDLGRRDVALLRLAQPVPPQIATPTAIATRGARGGESVEWYGYGCGNRRFGGDARTGTKQKLSFAFQQSANSCPGDSGGPTFFGENGPVFRVTSGYFGGSGIDIFGDPTLIKDQLDALADDWAARAEPPAPGADEPVESPEGPEQAQILQAVTDNQLVYVEWADTDDADYAQVLIVLDEAGGVGTFIYEINGGERTDEGNLFGFFRVSALCTAIDEADLGDGPHRVVAQVWPGVDQERADGQLLNQTIDCAP
ncbi:MAG: trypsin-like serine peptidase [Bradymonadia bacterium]